MQLMPSFNLDSLLIFHRWRIAHLYHTFPRQLSPELDPLLAWYTLSAETTVIKTQRDRPGQDSGTGQLGLLG